MLPGVAEVPRERQHAEPARPSEGANARGKQGVSPASDELDNTTIQAEFLVL